MITYIKSEWVNSSLLIKILNCLSISLIFASLIFMINILFDNSNETKKELSLIQSHLSIIEKFDKIFPGKWRHYLKEVTDISELEKDLIALSGSDIKIETEENNIILTGQINSIRKFINITSYLYNFRGLVIDQLEIDTINKDLINFKLSLIY